MYLVEKQIDGEWRMWRRFDKRCSLNAVIQAFHKIVVNNDGSFRLTVG